MSYFNTTNEAGDDLKDHQHKASNQDEVLLNHFKKNPEVEYIASELWINLFEADVVPITSIRRSLDTLLNEKHIKRMLNLDCSWKKKTCEIYGRKVFIYKFNL